MLAGIAVAGGAYATGAGPLVAAGLFAVGLVAGGGGYAYVNSQSPDVTVNSVEKGYWTGYCIPAKEGVAVYDATGSLDPTRFNLELLSDEAAVAEARQQLDELERFPIVMPREQNIEETFTGTLKGVRAEIERAEERTVRAPVIATTGEEVSALEFFTSAPVETADSADVEVEVSAEDAHEDVQALANLEQMAASDQGEAELEALSEKSQKVTDKFTGMQETAIELLNDHVGTAADAFGLVSYNFYCPDCQLDDIDSVVTLSDARKGEWYCDTCRSTHETEVVIPRHRIRDEIVNPVWDHLWTEKDDQRREVYENIEDQKHELQEKEFEQRREEIRSATDRIRDLRSRIRDLRTEAKAAEGKVDEIGDLMVKYDRLHKERKQEFRNDVEEAFVEIDRQTERILEETRNEEQNRIEQAQEAAREKAEMIREEKRRRQMDKFLAEQQRADERAKAEMEQRAALHEKEMGIEQRQHREDWMLRTRGRTSFSSLINRVKMRKDRLLGSSVQQNGGER